MSRDSPLISLCEHSFSLEITTNYLHQYVWRYQSVLFDLIALHPAFSRICLVAQIFWTNRKRFWKCHGKFSVNSIKWTCDKFYFVSKNSDQHWDLEKMLIFGWLMLLNGMSGKFDRLKNVAASSWKCFLTHGWQLTKLPDLLIISSPLFLIKIKNC